MRQDIPTFAGGEIGDDLLARSDTAKFRTSLRRARNVVLSPSGGVYNRPGQLFAGEVYDSARRSRVVTFQFSVNQGYALELGHQTLRVVSNGGYVLRKQLLITAITQGNPAVVSAVAHGYQVGWDVVFENILGMTEINGKRARVQSVTADTFVIALDTTTFGVFAGSGGGVAGNALGGVGGDPAPPAAPPVTDPPPAPPPFVDLEPIPPIYVGDLSLNLF